MGDVKLVAMMGLYLGRAVPRRCWSGFAAGAVVGMAMIARHGAAARKRRCPSGRSWPSAGSWGCWFGDEIVDWYLDTFFRLRLTPVSPGVVHALKGIARLGPM